MMKKEVTILNPTGLHARPASMFVQTAGKFKSKIFVVKDGNSINAKSIMGIMAGGIAQGMTVDITAEGDDEEDAVNALVQLITDKFGE